MDSARMKRAISRLASEIVEENHGAKELYIVGIRRRGVPLAERIVDKIESLEGVRPLYGIIDITLYRDDLSTVGANPVVNRTELNEDIDGNILVEGKTGLARELARMNLNLNFYTQWYWKIDLHNLLHFIALRMDSHAQYEIRVYAETIAKVVEKWVPHVWEAFADFRFEGTTLSRQELEILRLLLKGEKPDLKAHGLSVREQNEFKNKFGL